MTTEPVRRLFTRLPLGFISIRSAGRIAPPLIVAAATALGIAAPVAGLLMGGASAPAAYDDPELRNSSDWLSGWREPSTIAAAQSASFTALLHLITALAGSLVLVCAINALVAILARSGTRGEEVAIRAAVGARPARLLRRLVGEWALVAAVAAIPTLLLAQLVLALVRSTAPPASAMARVGADPTPVIAATAAFAAVTLLAWAAPAAIAWRRELRSFLSAGGRATAGPGTAFMHTVLVVVQIAAACVVVTAAALLTRGFDDTGTSPAVRGLDPRDTIVVRVELPPELRERQSRKAFFSQVTDRVGALPGVIGTRISTEGASVGLGAADVTLARTGYALIPLSKRRTRYHAVSEGFFAAAGTPVLEGEEFGDAGGSGDASPPIVVNNAFVSQNKLVGDLIGKRVQLHGMSLRSPWHTIIGVVSDIEAHGLGLPATPEASVYLPLSSHPPASAELAVRTSGDAPRHARSVLEAISSVEAGVRVSRAVTMTRYLSELRSPVRWASVAITLLAVLTAVCAAIGVYAAMSFSVTRRVREIGIRSALGASPAVITRMVVREGARLAAAGLVIGALLAVEVARMLQVYFLGVRPFDPIVFLGTAAAIGAVALLGSYLPARRAAALPPHVCLKTE